ncbi:MAG: hypothetical protein NTV20_01250 [Candidatus Shapirobacteria bacterium]|nr:hypothetical protein [Candidatus Shapirobacteria bacterium]
MPLRIADLSFFGTSPLVFVLMVLIFFAFLFFAFRLHKWLVPIMFFGMVTQSLTIIRSGLLYFYGMGFWGPNGHDGVWHLALINSLARHLNFSTNLFSLLQNPILANFNLKNYHFLFDLSVALIHKITYLPTLNLYFQIFPIIFSGFLGILTFLLIKKLTKNNLAACLAVFFAYFGGNFGWIVTLLRGQGLGGESMFWANQSISFSLNLQFFLSLILIIYGFYLYLSYLEKTSKKIFYLLILVFGLIIGIKAYGGIIILFGLGATTFWEFITKKKIKTLKVFFGSLIISLLVFLPNNWASSSLFVFSPLWLPRVMIDAPDRVGWLKLAQARQAYFATGLWFKWWLTEALGLAIFLIGNLGTRIIGLGKIFHWFRNWRKLSSFKILFLACLLPSGLIPLFFVQKGNPWNSIQFFYYFQFIFGLLAGLWLSDFLFKKKVWLKVFFIIILVLFTLPTTIGDLKNYLGYQSSTKIDFKELEALAFLKEQPEGIVLTYPHDYQAREKNKGELKPLYIYETTAYVSAFTNKQTFLEDEMNLEIMQVDWRSRRVKIEEFFIIEDEKLATEFLKENKIKYIYLVNGQNFKVQASKIGLKDIFQNRDVKIFRLGN